MPESRRGGIRPGIARLFRLATFRADRAREDADAEIRLHLQLRTQQLIDEGRAPGDARAEAERMFGPVAEARPRLHASAARREERLRMRQLADAARQDLAVALRGLRRSPGFVAVTVLCLALGIGANAATYSLFEELLLRPLPVREPARLVNFSAPGWFMGRDSWNQAGSSEALFTHPMFRDLERAQTVFTGIAAHRLFPASIAAGDRTAFEQGVLVSGSYFGVLGLAPAAGRLLGPADDVTPGAHPVAVLSHGYWTATLGADPGVVGKPILVNGRTLTVVGVAPRGFEGTTVGTRPRVFAPLAMAAELDPGWGTHEGFADRKWYHLYLFARLKPGVGIERARQAMNAIYRPILADVEAPLQTGASPQSLAQFTAKSLVLADGRRGQSVLHTETRTPLLFLFGITGLVVLIACANVANLMLARGAARTTEIAVRMSLGAGRARLLAQTMAESLLLAALGGAAALAVAYGLLAMIRSLIPPVDVGAGASLALEMRTSVLAFAAVVSLGTGLLFGLFPALHGTRPQLMTAIRSSAGQSGARSAARFRATLVTTQIALSMALLIAAGLFIRSLGNVSRVELGMRVENVVTFAVAPQLNAYESGRSRALLERIERDLAAVPGVSRVAVSTVPLLTGSTNGTNVNVEGFHREPDTDANSRVNRVGPGFVATLGMTLLAGREITEADRLGAPKVAVVNETFARKFGLWPNPVGKRMAWDAAPSDPLDVEIVGMVKDASYSAVKQTAPPQFFTAFRQDSTLGHAFYYARTSQPPERLMATIRSLVPAVDPSLPIIGLKPLPQQVRENVYMDRMVGVLSAAFAGLATLLAAVGLYGVLAYTVAQRTREFGVRMALGADPGRVRRLVLAQVGRMTLAGAAAGVAAALALGGLAETLLFGLQGRDPLVVAAAVATLAVVALGAGYVPAWRASKVDPMRAIRAE